MKKNFYEKALIYLLPILLIGYFYSLYASIFVLVKGILQNDIFEICLGAAYFLVLILVFKRLVFDAVLNRLDYLIVSENYIERHCLFRKKQRIYYDNPDCKIGVDIIPPHPRRAPKDEDRAWIYVSTDEYPEEKRGQIETVKNTRRFIKFPYSRKLAEAILESAPEQKCEELKAFYNKAISEEHIKPYRIE